MAKALAKVRIGVAIHQTGPNHEKGKDWLATKKHKKHRAASKTILCFAASSLLRGKLFFLFFVETLLVLLQPRFQIV